MTTIYERCDSLAKEICGPHGADDERTQEERARHIIIEAFTQAELRYTVQNEERVLVIADECSYLRGILKLALTALGGEAIRPPTKGKSPAEMHAELNRMAAHMEANGKVTEVRDGLYFRGEHIPNPTAEHITEWAKNGSQDPLGGKADS